MTGRMDREFDLPSLLPATYYCTDCAERLCEAARGIEGVSGTNCSKESGRLTVFYDPRLIEETVLEREVVRLGLEVVGAVEHAAYRLTGLD